MREGWGTGDFASGNRTPPQPPPARKRFPHLSPRPARPSRWGRLVEPPVPVIAAPAIAHIHATGSRDRLAGLIDAEGMGHVVLRVGNPQLRVDGREKTA